MLYNPSLQLFATHITINIGNADANGIKCLFPMLSSHNSTYFYIEPTFTVDTFNNYLYFDQLHPVYAVNGFIADVTLPTMVTYNLDMSGGAVRFIFSKAVSPSSLNLQVAFLQNSTDRRFDPSIALDGSIAFFGLSTQSNQLSLFLSSAILNYLKYKTIGITQDKAYLAYDSNFISDYVGNKIPPRYDSSVYQSAPRLPDIYTPDLIPPILRRWYIDRTVTPLNLQIFFSEPVILTDYSQINFFAQDGNGNIIPLELPLYIPPIVNNPNITNTTNVSSSNIENQFIESIPSALSTLSASSLVGRLTKFQHEKGLQQRNTFFSENDTVIDFLVGFPCDINSYINAGVATGIQACPMLTDSIYLDRKSYRLFLTVTSKGFTDMANTMNAITPILSRNPLYESKPGTIEYL